MHHLSVTTDLMILVRLELMDLARERKRSSGLKVYCQLRTNNSTGDTSLVRITSLSSLHHLFKVTEDTCLLWRPNQVKKQTAKEHFFFYLELSLHSCLCAFLSSAPSIKIDFNLWATCESESAAELWSTASEQDSELKLHLCTNVFKQRTWHS